MNYWNQWRSVQAEEQDADTHGVHGAEGNGSSRITVIKKLMEDRSR